MNRKNTITTIKHFSRSAAIWASLALLVLAFQLMAHGGFDHVIGTVVKVQNNVLTVKTAKGNVDVLLNDKTEITRNDQKALAGDLTPGTRVIVDIPEGSKDKIAHSVKLGVSGAHAHEASK
ncbi:MAG TPA: hypothetical protein VH640_23245 [Bryobacteraceae bacterium]|jgi:hypothetical protein